MNFYTLFLQSLPRLLEGLVITLQLTILSLLFAIIIGMISCFFKISKWKLLNWIATIYLSIIRGTPLMVQAYFLYFGITSAMGIKIDSFWASVIVLTLNAGAYLSEIFRSGISAVNKGQMEAARSLGLPYHVAMGKVIMTGFFPSVVNQFIITLKDTSILSVIGVGELMRQGTLIVSRTFKGFEVYAMVAIAYFIVVMVLTKISQIIERRLSSGKSKG